jgi:hypothetical protein
MQTTYARVLFAYAGNFQPKPALVAAGAVITLPKNVTAIKVLDSSKFDGIISEDHKYFKVIDLAAEQAEYAAEARLDSWYNQHQPTIYG